MKTDAAVLLSLVGELSSAVPSNDKAAYAMLAEFNKKNSQEFNVMSLVYDSCGRLRTFVELIPNTTEAHKSSFHSAIKSFENSFGLANLGISWKQFLANLGNPMHVQSLHFLDYMIQSQPFWKEREVDVSDAVGLLDELEGVISEIKIPEYLKGVLQNDIVKLKYILANYERFGEQDYWEKFQKITGLFGSVFTTLDDAAREQASPVMTKMIGRVVQGMSISADVLQIATAASALLPRV